MNSIFLLGLKVDRLTMDEAVETIMSFVADRSPRHVVTADASMVVLAKDDLALKEIVCTADLVTPDGAGILWASRLLGHRIANKVSGVDLVEKLCQKSSQTPLRLFFLGAAPTVAATAADKLRAKYPGANIVGTQDGYFKPEDEQRIVSEIQNVSPDILFVAFGIPKQEKFIQRNKAALAVPVSIGVGGSFDVYSGLVKRAPVWMQNSGLEWIYRLFQNPKKISKVMTLPRFVAIALWASIRGSNRQNDEG